MLASYTTIAQRAKPETSIGTSLLTNLQVLLLISLFFSPHVLLFLPNRYFQVRGLGMNPSFVTEESAQNSAVLRVLVSSPSNGEGHLHLIGS